MQPAACPFCECNHVVVIDDDSHEGAAVVAVCSDCGARGPTSITEADALEHWNHRGKPHPAV